MALTPAYGQGIGAYYMLIAKRDSNGYPVGQVADPESIANATTMQPLLITSLISFTPSAPTLEEITNRGGMSVRSQTVLGYSTTGNAQFQLSEYDERFVSLIKGTSTDVTEVDNWAETATNINQRTFPRFVVIVGQRFTNTVNGAEEWLTRMYHNCQITVSDEGAVSQASGENPNPVTFTLTPSKSTRKLTGRAFSASAGLFVTDASDTVTRVRSKYALALTSFKAATASTQYVLGYRPVSSDVTGNANNSITKNGTTFTATSLSTSTGVLVFPTGADADMHVCVYLTDFVAI